MQLTLSEFSEFLDCPRHLWASANNDYKPEKSKMGQYFSKQKKQLKEFSEDFLTQNILPQYPKESILKKDLIAETDLVSAKVDFAIQNSETGELDLYFVKIGLNPVGDRVSRLKAAFTKKAFEQDFKIGKLFFIHLNRFYKRKKNLDISKLLVVTDLDPYLAKPTKEIDKLISDAINAREAPYPDDLPATCRPKTCPVPQICFPQLPEYSIFDLKRVSPTQIKSFIANGILDIKDIPDEVILKREQKKQIFTAKKGEAVYNLGQIKDWLSNLQFPLYFLDYETFSFLIPEYIGRRPAQQVPFQYSIHILDKKGNLDHREFLNMDKNDSAENLTKQLQKDIGDTGSILVWNASFEKTINRELGVLLGEEEYFVELNNRVLDLADIFSSQEYDHPDFKGSWSIKKVLPVLVPELSYDNLEVGNGEDASIGWFEAVYGGKSSSEFEKSLLEYCKLDTLAMVKIYEFFIDLVKENTKS